MALPQQNEQTKDTLWSNRAKTLYRLRTEQNEDYAIDAFIGAFPQKKGVLNRLRRERGSKQAFDLLIEAIHPGAIEVEPKPATPPTIAEGPSVIPTEAVSERPKPPEAFPPEEKVYQEPILSTEVQPRPRTLQEIGEAGFGQVRPGLKALGKRLRRPMVREFAAQLPNPPEVRRLIEAGKWGRVVQLAEDGMLPFAEELGESFLTMQNLKIAELPDVQRRAALRLMKKTIYNPKASRQRERLFAGELPEFRLVTPELMADNPAEAVAVMVAKTILPVESLAYSTTHPEKWPEMAAVYAAGHFVVVPMVSKAWQAMKANPVLGMQVKNLPRSFNTWVNRAFKRPGPTIMPQRELAVVPGTDISFEQIRAFKTGTIDAGSVGLTPEMVDAMKSMSGEQIAILARHAKRTGKPVRLVFLPETSPAVNPVAAAEMTAEKLLERQAMGIVPKPAIRPITSEPLARPTLGPTMLEKTVAPTMPIPVPAGREEIAPVSVPRGEEVETTLTPGVEEKIVRPAPKPAKAAPKPKTKSISILPEKTNVLAEIDAAITEAPEEAVTDMDIEIGIPEKVAFKIDGGVSIFNTKAALTKFRKLVQATPEKMKVTLQEGVTKPRPVAANREMIGELLRDAPEGLFSDGTIIIKGKPPKSAKTGVKKIPEGILEEHLSKPTEPAELLYYSYEGPDLVKLTDEYKAWKAEGMITEDVPEQWRSEPGDQAVSAIPIGLTEEKNYPLVTFKSGENYYTYNQFKFNMIRKRFKDAEFGITPDGTLIATVEGEPVAALAPTMPKDAETAVRSDPPLGDVAREAGLLAPTEAEIAPVTPPEEVAPPTIPPEETPPVETSDSVVKVKAVLSDTPIHIDDIAYQTGLTPSDVSGALIQLELRGEAHRQAGLLFTAIAPTVEPPAVIPEPTPEKPSESSSGYIGKPVEEHKADVAKDISEAKEVPPGEAGFLIIPTLKDFSDVSDRFRANMSKLAAPQRDVVTDAYGAIEKWRSETNKAGLYADWTKDTLRKFPVSKNDSQLVTRWLDDPEKYGAEYDQLPEEAKNLATALRADYERMRNLATDMGILKGWRENYTPHIWRDNETKLRRVLYPAGGRLGKGFRFAKQRTIDTIDEGEALGLHPVLDPALLNSIYKYQLYRTIANRNLMMTLQEMNREDGLPIIMGRPKNKDKLAVWEKEYEYVNIPAFGKYMYSGEAGGMPMLIKMPAKADPEIATALNNAFDPWAKRGAINNAYRVIRGRIKRLIMMNPLIHGWNILSDVYDEVNFNPYTTGKVFIRGRKLYKQKDAMVEYAVETGLAVQTSQSVSVDLRRELLESSEALRGIWEPIGKLEQWSDRVLWGGIVRYAQLGLFEYLVPRLEKRHPDWSREQVGMTAATYINTLLGTLPHTWMSRPLRESGSILLFARNWTFSNIDMVIKAATFGRKGLGVKALTSDQKTEIGVMYQKHLLKGIFALLMTANMVQLARILIMNKMKDDGLLDGEKEPLRTTFENEKGHRVDIDTGIKTKTGQKIYIVPFTFRYMRDYLGYGADIKNLEGRTLYNKLEPVLKQTIEQIANYSIWQSQEIAKPGAPTYDRLKQRAIYFFEGISPSVFYAKRPGKVKTPFEWVIPYTGTWIRRGAPGGRFTGLIFEFRREQGYEDSKLDQEIDEAFQRGGFSEATNLVMKRYMPDPSRFAKDPQGAKAQLRQNWTNRVMRVVAPLNFYYKDMTIKERRAFHEKLEKHNYSIKDLRKAMEEERRAIELRGD